jgi:hypothetical protein
MLSKRPSAEENTLTLAIQEFNRECAEERTKRTAPVEGRRIKHIQNYDIFMDEMIGSGTFSKVYRGRDCRKDAIVAVKVVELKKI